ncbi:MAG: 3-phosphoshikimate 1-carboxyvinyltransferase [Lachnospiraceae bacterium]|nr:3-phosphoshikimate 1-carboxyvinyltransferase [Candidatus Colinaster scatohippi]
MKAVIKPSKAEGSIMAPPSKSMAHRYMICAALAMGESIVNNISYSQDILATIDCISALGAEVIKEPERLIIRGRGISAKGPLTLACRECGSTLRFMVPIAMMRGEDTLLTGSETLMTRPMSVYEDLAKVQGLIYEKSEDGILVNGRLGAGIYEVPGNISSQFISGLMFVLPLLNEKSEICLIPPVDSRSYIDLTIKALLKFGVDVKWKDETTLEILGRQTYSPTEVTIEGDYSNAAFLEVFNTLDGQVTVNGLDSDSRQGDRVYYEYFSRLIGGRSTLDISDCPDLGPVLFVVAATHYGGTFTGTRRLAIKESNRGKVMCEELAKFGIESTFEEDCITIEGGEPVAPEGVVHGYNDHRIVMAMVTMLSITGGSVDDAMAVNKSFPDYYERIKKIGIDVELTE